MSIQQSISIERSPQQIFEIYKDVNSWAQWDPDVEGVGMEGSFSAGTRGWLKPTDGPKTNTEITEVKEPDSFTVEARLPLCRMVFKHDLIPSAKETTVTHTVYFKGLLAPVFSRLISGKIRKGIQGTMQGLKQYAEQR